MGLSALPAHGGDLAAAEARWGRPAQGWLDLSTGVNPWPYPLPEIPATAWARLPGAAEEEALLDAARAAWGVPAGFGIVAAPGSQPLIQAIPRLLEPGPVAVLGPTYAEHAKAWTAAGHQVIETADLDHSAPVMVAVNPNNPDGRVLAPDRLAARPGLLVVDEAFADLTPELSLIRRPRPGLIILRSFGKFFGLAGLRLGFCVAEPEVAAKLRALLGPWAVSGPALAVGAAALADRNWAEAARARVRAASTEMASVLERAGLEIVGGAGLFLLARHPQASELYQRLGRAGILVRAFAHAPDQLRFGLPPDARGIERLRAALSQ